MAIQTPARPSKLRQPRPVRIESGDVCLSGLDYGNATAPPMVLLHGIRDLSWSMHRIAEAFCADFHVVSLDLRGHGDSDKPGIYTLPHYLSDLHQALEQLSLKPRPVLLGHSLGGQIVAQYAGVFPEVASAVVILEGLGPPLREDEQTPRGRRRQARRAIESLANANVGASPGPLLQVRQMSGLEEATERFLRRHPRLEAPVARILVERGTCPHPKGGLRWKWDPRVQSTWASVTREQNEERWSWIRCPVLVVTAELAETFWQERRGLVAEGELSRDEVRRRLACFQDAAHVEIPNAGHMVHFDEPTKLNAAIRQFLETALSRTPGLAH